MSVNLDRIKQQRQEAKEEAARRGAKFYDWKDGRNLIRILPPWEGCKDDDFSRQFGKHWHLGADGKQIVYCPKICFSQPCPICEGIHRMYKSDPDKATKEYLAQISASPRYYANIIDLKAPEENVQVAEFPKTVIEEIWNLMVDDMVGLGDITSPDAGYDLIIDKTGKKLLTRYSVRAMAAPTKLANLEWLEQRVNLDDFVKTESYENLKLIFEGRDPKALPAPDSDLIEVGYSTPKSSIPACFGSFNEDVPECLECIEQDECELKMLAQKAAAKEAAIPVPKPSVKPAPATPAPATPAAAIDEDALLAEMQAAIDC